ncbi:DUF3231 family protein [Paenibacillus hexagrammi]|uniref:DUF3231 family protein n=1 Tax=Paenibacillus hexagrammi TaxID=2908839 RepID=A0ABY3SLC5_9BACL|nr:DUF3231 family protein [Paenibacillus sp. YPD9-1]UJF34867.1 DUF3231 family protein [Paenibacillus sp. YPD9-1]
MEQHHIRLTASEIGGLWTNYVTDSMFICIFQYFLQHVEDREIQQILEHALDLAEQHIQVITKIFHEEGHAIPLGFTEGDVHVSAPRLFSDEFFLFFTKQMAKGALVTYGGILALTFRKDIREHFMSCLSSTMELFNEATDLLMSKGLEVKSPYIPYIEQVDMVEKQHFLAGWFGDQRPLTAMEITNLYTNIQTNHLGRTLVTAFGQVAQHEDVRSYMRRGKELASKHLEVLGKFLAESDLPIPMTWDASVLPESKAPFSDKIMMFMISLMSASGIGNYGFAISASPRRDIASTYSRLFAETALFAEDGANIEIKHAWMEKPPQAANRAALMK